MTAATKETAAAVFRSIANARRSCKRFQPGKKIDSKILKDVLESTIRSPSSFNLQPTQIIMVQDDTIKNELAKTAMLGIGNQYRTKDCSVLAVFLSDLESSERIKRIYELERESNIRHPNYLAMMPVSTAFFLGEGHAATFIKQVTTDLVSNNIKDKPMPVIEPIQSWSYKNTSLIIQSYVLGMTSYNIQTSIMEGFDARRTKEILRIPDRYDIPMMVATGYEYEKEDFITTPRLNINEVVFSDTFGAPIDLDNTNDDDDDPIEESA